MLRNTVRNARQPLLVACCVAASGCALDARTDAGSLSEGPVDATQSELRRSDFGMSRSVRVRDASGTWQTVPLVAANIPTTVSTDRTPLADTGISSFTNLSWVGDANSYVEVFDSSLITTFSLFDPPIASDGSSCGRFFRVFYPHASNAETMLYLPPPFEGILRFPRALNVALPEGRSWKALRHYDRGECSQEVTWTTMLTAIVDGLTPRLDAALSDLGGATRSGPATGTPTIRVGTWGLPGNRDTFTVKAGYHVGACDGAMTISFTGRFEVMGVLPTFTVTNVSTSLDFGDDFCAGGLAFIAHGNFDAGALQNEISAGVTATLRADLGPAIRAGMRAGAAQQPIPGTRLGCTPGARGDELCAAVIRSGLPSVAAALRAENASCMEFEGRPQCMFIPSFRRINTRGDALEIVLVDNRSDAFYPIYNAAGVCARPEGSPTTSLSARYGSVSLP